MAEAGAGAEAEAGTGVGAGCLLAEREGGPESASESLLDGLGRGTVNIESYVSKKSTKNNEKTYIWAETWNPWPQRDCLGTRHHRSCWCPCP